MSTYCESLRYKVTQTSLSQYARTPVLFAHTSATILTYYIPANRVICLSSYSYLLIAKVVRHNVKLHTLRFTQLLQFHSYKSLQQLKTINLQYAIDGPR